MIHDIIHPKIQRPINNITKVPYIIPNCIGYPGQGKSTLHIKFSPNMRIPDEIIKVTNIIRIGLILQHISSSFSNDCIY